jgi:hypothetical protein
MAAPAIEQVYRYVADSEFTVDQGDARLLLQTSGGIAPHPRLFEGWITQGRPAAASLLVLGRVARTRFYTPPAMVARIIAAADPIATADGENVRFEVFSPCNGVYVRLDLGPSALDGAFFAMGTTNVDFGPRMREVLTHVSDGGRVFLSMGPDDLAIATSGGKAVERRVRLPVRWIKGLAEVQLVQSKMELEAEVDRSEAVSFLRSLPVVPSRGNVYLERIADGLRISRSPAGTEVGGIERLRMLRDLAFMATRLRIFSVTSGDPATAWLLDLPGMRVHVVLSPDRTRGFSGEGAVLASLASHGDTAKQGAVGRLGYDLHEHRFFPRELPFDLAGMEAEQPRLRAARRLAADHAVKFLTNGEAVVISSGVEHRVRWAADGPHCTCPWFARYAERRGPCKHVLAAQLTRA